MPRRNAPLPRYETYRAKANAKAASRLAATTSPFTIEVRFIGGLNKAQKAAFKAAADRWTKVIVGDLPSVNVDGETIDDVLIVAQGIDIDGPGRILGQAGPSHLRPSSAGKSAYLPVKGMMSFDTADLRSMQKKGTLRDVIAHEMGHVLGVGTIWDYKGLLKAAGTSNPTFTGKAAKAEYKAFKGGTGTLKNVPVENTGGEGTADSHWRETVFRNELMSGFISSKGNPLSRLTVASLQDLGYVVDLSAAEPYTLPNLRALAERGALTAHIAPVDDGMMLPNIPIVLPGSAMA